MPWLWLQPSWSPGPVTEEWGDWSSAYKTQGWLGTFVIKSKDGGKTWSQMIPVNVRPLKHGGCRVGCWEMPDGALLMGLYGRIRGYGEEGEGYVRIAMVENEQRLRQAARNIRKYFQSMGINTPAMKDV